MEQSEIKKVLADLIEALAATDHRVNGLALSIMAMRAAFQEIDRQGRFEQLYAKHYAAAESELLRQKSDDDVRLLLEVAKRLRTND